MRSTILVCLLMVQIATCVLVYHVGRSFALGWTPSDVARTLLCTLCASVAWAHWVWMCASRL